MPAMDAPVPPSEGALRRAERMATPRLTRELKTLAAMQRIYCADHHGQVAGLDAVDAVPVPTRFVARTVKV